VGARLRDPVLEIRYVCLARYDHARLSKKSLSLAEFAMLSHIAISPRGEPTTFVDGLLAEAGGTRNIVLTIPHFLAAPPIVARTDLVAIIDVSIARLFAGDKSLRIFELPVPLRPIAIDLLMPRARVQESALKWLRQQCFDV